MLGKKKKLLFSFIKNKMFGRSLLIFSVTVPIIQKHKFHYGSAMIPHPRKLKRGGEDALFANDYKLGIFDGVSAWMEEDNIDAGIFAFSLSKFTQEKDLKYAIENTTVKGSSTACVLSLDNDILQTYNIGDSGFLLLRKVLPKKFIWYNYLWNMRNYNEGNYIIVNESTPMMHNESTPFQIGSKDAPTQDNIPNPIYIPVQIDDLIIMGTDGLFDNLSNDEIVEYANRFDMDDIAAPKQFAWKLAYKAKQKYNVVDDISVIVAKIIEE